MKDLLNLKGAQRMGKEAQQSIIGGYNYIACFISEQCPTDWFCNGNHCVPCKYSTGPNPFCD